MSKINVIQNAIKELEGGGFQKLFDAYLYKKYQFKNIQTLGVQDGTNKTTKGTPDSFVVDEDEKYILIMYGTVGTEAFGKIKKDILSCFNRDKLEIEESKIKKIICAYSSTNIHVEQQEELKSMISGIEVETIGLSTISHDLLVNFPFLAAEYLHIQVDTHQIFSRDEFIKAYDKNGMNAPLDMQLCYREDEKEKLYTMINSSKITLVTGGSGVGKTRLVLEVCKKFESEGWNVLCVKNNGELLYNDIQYYTSDEGSYVFFIDDANQTTSLEYILDYIVSLSENIIVNIVMTVRDYAKYRVKSIICNYIIPAEMTVTVFKEEEIKEILKRNLGILNEDYLYRIVQIAKGNIRLAILAGKIAIQNGFMAIRNATDIFVHYYGKIIESMKLTEQSVDALFVVSLLGTVHFKESVIAQKILELANINSEGFTELCHDLNEKELIDLYQNEVAKVSDQSLGNYILEYVLIEKKTILISQLLQVGFPEFKNKLVYALNTIIKLFYSEDIKRYIEEQVNASWNLAEEGQQNEYLKCFYTLNEEKSLAILKQKIESVKTVEVDILNFDIEGKKNNNKIECDEIIILSRFKYSKYFEDAIELLLLYYKKRPDYIMDFYFAFSDRMSYDVSSYKLDYEKEYKMVECLWRHADNGKDISVSILLIHVLKEMLKCSFYKSESGENNRTINMFNLQIIFNDGSRRIRSFIWQILSVLYTHSNYEKLVSDIVATCHVKELKTEETRKFYEYDLKFIKKLFFNKWDSLSFEQCKILWNLEQYSEWLEIEDKDFFRRYIENKDFMIYHTLVEKHRKGRTWTEDETERKRQIEEMIEDYEKSEYVHLFRICRECEERNKKEYWSLKEGLDIVFTVLEQQPEIYYDIVKVYLQNKAPYGYSADKIIIMLLEKFGFKKTKKFIEENEFPYKRNWLSTIWRIMPNEMVDIQVTNGFLQFIEEEGEMEEPFIPPVLCLEKYQMFDSNIIKKVSEIIINCFLEKKYRVAYFFGNYYQDVVLEKIVNLFENNWEMLEKLYLLAIGEDFDYKGKLLIKLVRKDFSFWDKFTNKLAGNIHRTMYEHNVFESIWEMDNYKELIQIACDNMLDGYFGFMVEDEGTAIFANSQNTPEFIKQRKTLWIREYMRQNIENKNNIKMIFNIIAVFFPEDRKMYLLELMNYKRDVELFKSIPLFSSFSSWGGSEVPLIDKKIDFLSDLIDAFKGIDFIEHRAYLKEEKNSYECYKQEVLIREYLMNEDIA